jgi:transcriptional regulator with XRE-family HTH domain
MRNKDGATLEQLSKMAGIALGHLSDLENGKRQPTARIIAKLATAMNVPKSMLEPRAAA